jgi:hypothetical protein
VRESIVLAARELFVLVSLVAVIIFVGYELVKASRR